MANVQYRGTGRRKSSVARVILTPGTGNFVINGKEAREYLASDVLNMIVNQPLELTNTKDKFDVTVNVYGGGYSGHNKPLDHFAPAHKYQQCHYYFQSQFRQSRKIV